MSISNKMLGVTCDGLAPPTHTYSSSGATHLCYMFQAVMSGARDGKFYRLLPDWEMNTNAILSYFRYIEFLSNAGQQLEERCCWTEVQ